MIFPAVYIVVCFRAAINSKKGGRSNAKLQDYCDCQDLLCLLDILRGLNDQKAEKRVDGCQPLVSCRCFAMPGFLKPSQKTEDKVPVNLGNVQLIWGNLFIVTAVF